MLDKFKDDENDDPFDELIDQSAVRTALRLLREPNLPVSLHALNQLSDGAKRRLYRIMKHLVGDRQLFLAEDAGGAGEFENPDRVGARQLAETRRDTDGHVPAVVVAPTASAAAAWREEERDSASSTMRPIRWSYSQPWALAMRERPAESEMSGFGLTSST